MTRDSYLGNIMKPLSLNRYAYTGNNPVMYADPSGHFFEELGQKIKQGAEYLVDKGKEAINYAGEKLYEIGQEVKQEAVAIYDEYVAPVYDKYVAPVIRGTQEKISTVVEVTQVNMNLAKDVMKNPTAYSDADFANMGPLGPTMKRLVTIRTKGCGDALTIDSQKVLDNLQTGLDIGGMVPGFGEPIDGVNGLIYLARGDKLNAGLSLGAMIPFIGDGVTGAKLARKAVKAGEDTAEIVKDINRGAEITEGLSNAERKYVPNPKHDAPSGKISPNPFGNDAVTGQKSLETAYSSSGNKQLYNVYDDKLVKFQPDNAGGFHPYEVINPAQEVPADVLRQMKKDGRISNVQYNKWIKNK
jgi:hypothetical protein